MGRARNTDEHFELAKRMANKHGKKIGKNDNVVQRHSVLHCSNPVKAPPVLLDTLKSDVQFVVEYHLLDRADKVSMIEAQTELLPMLSVQCFSH